MTAVNPSTGLSYPLVSLLGPADHHDSLYLKPLVELAQAIGIEIKLISADNACHDKEGSLSAETGVHLITPVSNDTSLPDLLIEMAGFRKKKPKDGDQQLELFRKAA
ncbi:MAG: hypothetical protein D3906_18025 [Candidatus Electrothrix sp. AUS1_2]|nr:hypothetical protein [Candidatus Electrothrix sp. AUS1_2]